MLSDHVLAARVVLDMVKLKEGWRIADITWPATARRKTLRGLFTQR
jgi:hypothetical protein